ncbi:MAG: caspase family protein [Candidatus Methylumidiphilus sp.]
MPAKGDKVPIALRLGWVALQEFDAFYKLEVVVMMRVLISCLLFSLAWALPAVAERGLTRIPSAGGANRVALVVGNSHYTHVPILHNPGNDAKLIAQALRAQGFDLVGDGAMFDLDKAGLDRALKKFGDRLAQTPGAVAVFYYSGHGLQADDRNYLLPVDANPNKPSDLRRQTVTADDVVQEMKDAGAALNVVILDACRNNPFGERGVRDTSPGLAEMRQVPKGTLIVYATQPGNVAQDGPKDGNSPFAAALGKAIGRSGLELRRTFDAVGLDVMSATRDVQQPWMSNSPLEGEFCFAGCATVESDTMLQLREAEEKIRRLTEGRPAEKTPAQFSTDMKADSNSQGLFPKFEPVPNGETVRICDESGCFDRPKGYASFHPERLSPQERQENDRYAALESLAAQDSRAAYDLALRYFRGDGVRQNPYQAIKWMRAAAERGELNAQMALGRLYLTGLAEMGADPGEAERWLSAAAAGGDREAPALLKEATEARKSKQAQYDWYARHRSVIYQYWHSGYTYLWRWQDGRWWLY